VVDVTALRFNLKDGGSYTLTFNEGTDIEGVLKFVANQHVLTLVDEASGRMGSFWTRDLTSVDIDGRPALVPRGRERTAPAPTLRPVEVNEGRPRSAPAPQGGRAREEHERGGWSM
jgi:hypothetical protein